MWKEKLLACHLCLKGLRENQSCFKVGLKTEDVGAYVVQPFQNLSNFCSGGLEGATRLVQEIRDRQEKEITEGIIYMFKKNFEVLFYGVSWRSRREGAITPRSQAAEFLIIWCSWTLRAADTNMQGINSNPYGYTRRHIDLNSTGR